MATWFCDSGAAGGGDGSEGTPFNTISALVSAIGSDSDSAITANLAGVFRNQPFAVTMTGKSLTVQQWEGEDQCVLRGDTPLATLTQDSGDVYNVTLATGLNIGSVVWQWDTNIDADDRHFGHLIEVDAVEDVASTEFGWHYNSSTGVLTINTDGLSTTAGDFAWVNGGSNALAITSGSGHVVDGLHAYLWADPADGYGMKMSSVTGSTIRNCTALDCGQHSIGIAAASTTDNIIENCVGNGVEGANATNYVIANIGGGVASSGCVIRNCEAGIYPWIHADGTYRTHNRITGYFYHTGGGAADATDVRFENCEATGYDGVISRDYAMANLAAPSDAWDSDTYAGKVIGCTSRGCEQGSNAANIANVRCSYHTVTTTLVNQAPYTFNDGAGARLYEACEIVLHMTQTSNAHGFNTAVGGDRDIRFKQCSVYVSNESVSALNILRSGNAADFFRAHGCVFGFRATSGTRRLVGNATATLDFADCAYFNLSAYENTGNSTEANWQTNVDPDGVYLGTENPFGDVTGVAGLFLNFEGTLFETILPTTPFAPTGIDGFDYTGRIGAYQQGLSGELCAADTQTNAGGIATPASSTGFYQSAARISIPDDLIDIVNVAVQPEGGGANTTITVSGVTAGPIGSVELAWGSNPTLGDMASALMAQGLMVELRMSPDTLIEDLCVDYYQEDAGGFASFELLTVTECVAGNIAYWRLLLD